MIHINIYPVRFEFRDRHSININDCVMIVMSLHEETITNCFDYLLC